MNNKKLKLAASPLKEMARYSEAMTGEKAAPAPAGLPWAAVQGENAFPMGQKVVLKEILPQRADCKTFVFGPDEEAGQMALAVFAPGQHISLTALVGGCPVSRPYTLVSTPGQARKGEYRLTIKGIFESGVTVWTDPAKIGVTDYGDNTPLPGIAY